MIPNFVAKSIPLFLLLLLIVGIAFVFFFMGVKMVVDHPRVGLSSFRMWQLSEEWRAKNNLPPYNKNDLMCNFAAVRAYEIQSDFSHTKFSADSTLKSILWQDGFVILDENIMRADVKAEEYAFGLMLESPPHKQAMEKRHTDACIICVDNSCAMIMGSKKDPD